MSLTARAFRSYSCLIAFLAVAGCSGQIPASSFTEGGTGAGALLASGGGFSTFTYNVAGLPQGISSAAGDRAAATALISCYVKQFDFVNVQEDFNYHAALYDRCDDHPYRSPTSGGAAFGSGLNSLSRFPYSDWERVTWSDCNGVDCLTPKGFTLARARLAEGVTVDVYNLHAQAQTEAADLAARRKNVLQLLTYIEANSAGHAVIVMGDTNTRYTRSDDNIGQFLLRGYTDVWIDKIRGGAGPSPGAEALVCAPEVTSADCEVVDKVFYRDNGYVGLEPLTYRVAADAVDANGVDLSDHRGLAATWRYATRADRQLSDAWGGPHGTSFNDVSLLPENPVVRQLKLRSGSRVDRVETVLTHGYPFAHGGTGGTENTLTLAAGESLTSVTLCTGEHQGHTRVFYARFVTSSGRELAGGAETATCATSVAPLGWQIVAFHGRSGEEVDKLGVVYAPVPSAAPGPAQGVQFVNRESGACLDIDHGAAGDGTKVIQWPCNGGLNQRFSYDEASGLVRSMQDPHFCLDNAGSFADGAGLILWTCIGNANQRFDFDSNSGKLALRSASSQAVEVLLGSSVGTQVQTWTFWQGPNQGWRMVR